MHQKSDRTERHNLRLTKAESAALTEAAKAMDLTENGYLRRALHIVLRLDAFTSEPAVYQSWFRGGLNDLFASANAAAVLSQAILCFLFGRFPEVDLADRESADRTQAMAYLIAQARDRLSDPETLQAFAHLMPPPDDGGETFWQEVDHGRKDE